MAGKEFQLCENLISEGPGQMHLRCCRNRIISLQFDYLDSRLPGDGRSLQSISHSILLLWLNAGCTSSRMHLHVKNCSGHVVYSPMLTKRLGL